MIQTAFFFIYAIIALLIAFQDFEGRAVSVLWFVFFALLAVPYYLYISTFDWISWLLNIAFVMTLLALSGIILKLRVGKKIKEMLGAGDVVFLLISTLYFDFPSFVIWLNVGLVLSLAGHLVLIRIATSYKRSNSIPLAGFLAIIFTFAIVFENYVTSIAQLIY